MKFYDKDSTARITATGMKELRKGMEVLETNSTFGNDPFETGTKITVEDLLKLKRDLDKNYPKSISLSDWVNPVAGPFQGMRVFENPYLPTTKTETYEVEVEKTFRERWIEPLLHGITMPFEPWVKTKTVVRTREVPCKVAFVFDGNVVASPGVISSWKSMT